MEFKDGEVVEMKLDLNDGILSFRKISADEYDLFVADIQREKELMYRMEIYLHFPKQARKIKLNYWNDRYREFAPAK